MLNIRALGPRELEQVLLLLDRFGTQAYATLQRFKQLTLPFLTLSKSMSARHQFLPAIYVACEHKRVLGLVVLSPDGNQNRRWRVEELIVDPEVSSFDIGAQLLGYVINRYGAEGVQTFIAHVSEGDSDGLALLKSNGFRYCTRLHWLALHDDRDKPVIEPPQFTGTTRIREATGCDAKRVSQLYNDALPPEVRVTLEKQPADFRLEFSGRYWVDRFRGQFFRRWILEETQRRVVIGVVELASRNLTDFHMSVVVSPAWTNHTQPLQCFGVGMVHRISRHSGLTMTIFDHDKQALDLAEQLGFKGLDRVDVLVKDYWIPLKPEVPKLTSPVLLRHISPA